MPVRPEPADMLDYWDTRAATSLADGKLSFARSVGEMTWAVTEVIGAANLISYKSEVNRFVPSIRRSCSACMTLTGSAATCSWTS
ncbi:MAG: MEDS domain-containing protein [Actinomycetota bacterium]|nr:MEDS domain-containing protein [Actinomycetota bacterium]